MMAVRTVVVSGIVAVAMVVVAVVLVAGLVLDRSEEDAEADAEGVVRGECRDDQADPPQQVHALILGREGRDQDLVLAEEGCRERERREPEAAEHREQADQPEAGHLEQAAELADVELAGEAVHDRTGGQEEQRLEERVGEDVVRGAEGGADAKPEEHVSQLGDRGVRPDALHVVLRHADRRGEQGGQSADPGHGGQGIGIDDEEREHAGDQVHARSDHGRGVDERRDRRGAFHRVRQPDVERQLRALAERAEHEQPGNRLRGPFAARRGGLDRLPEGGVLDRAVALPGQEERKREAQVADAVDDEGLLRGGHRLGLREVVADEQVAREADAFPAEVEHHEVAAHDEAAHREEEDADGAEEARVALADVRLHVLARVERDERAEAGHEEHPEDRQPVDVQVDVRGEPVEATAVAPGPADPVEQVDDDRRLADHALQAQDGGERPAERGDGQRRRQLGADLHPAAEQAEHAAEQGQQQRQAGPAELRGGLRIERASGKDRRQHRGCGDHDSASSFHASALRVSLRR